MPDKLGIANSGNLPCSSLKGKMQGASTGSLSSQFTSGAKPVIDGGAELIGNGFYQSKLRTITPVGRRGNKPVGKR